MNRIRTTAGAVGLATLATTFATLAPANAMAKTHTLQFTVRTLVSQNAGNKLVETDRVIVAGKSVGFTANNCVFDFAKGQAVCDVAVALPSGILYAHVTVNAQTGASQGIITGGTRTYKGAKGVTVGIVGSRPSDTRITVVYHS